ncbi:MAG TPA: EAL domain-containing protein [Terracidiphilus sp.]|nr:EAL domain-containing protein [Terracidiphilus sp.]
MLSGTYNPWLVLASLLVAVMASYTALDMAGRVTATRGRSAGMWLCGGSVAMGIGIWSMHFIGMLAFTLPIPMSYDPAITFLSLLIAIASSAFALWIVCQNDLSRLRLSLGTLLMGAGVCCMHYTGMAAMRMMPPIHYIPSLLVLSCVIAVAASGTALWIAFHLRSRTHRIRRLRSGAAVVMGIAIAGMHYTAMAAAQFPANSACQMTKNGVTGEWLAPLIILFALAVLSIALTISIFDRRIELRTEMLASSLANAHKELQFLTLHDNLTKVPNRALFQDRLQQAAERVKRDRSSFAVFVLNLDGFKQINDAFGHQTGDRMLIEVAIRIQAVIRAHDTLARLGGDEFVLLAGANSPADAASLAEKLMASIREPIDLDGLECHVSASIGIALYNAKAADHRELLTKADRAMHHAKELGRDCYCFFEARMNDDAQEQLSLLHDLRLAHERNEFVLFYQPKLDARSSEVIGAEALLRWMHPSRGIVSPDQFIPLAEKSGLIISIGNWVLDEACRQMSAWRNMGHANWSIAVNLSPLQFNHPNLVEMVAETLHRHALEPRRLTLEITESTAMRDVEASMIILDRLTEAGVHISIDDFGTGYSSLLYLKRLPAKELKIDRGFVRDLEHDKEDEAIIAAIVALGHTLNIEIVAEGVETIEQQRSLTRMGCTSLQGYLFGRPMPATQFIHTFAEAQAKNTIAG